MEEFNKTENIKTHDQLKNLLNNYKDFVANGGKPPNFIGEFIHLVPHDEKGKITTKHYTWVDKTVEEIEYEKKVKQDAIDLIESYKANTEKWRTEVIKPWSIGKLIEWIDQTYVRPLQFPLTHEECLEREAKRKELLTYHNQTVYTIDLVKPEPPSYIRE